MGNYKLKLITNLSTPPRICIHNSTFPPTRPCLSYARVLLKYIYKISKLIIKTTRHHIIIISTVALVMELFFLPAPASPSVAELCGMFVWVAAKSSKLAYLAFTGLLLRCDDSDTPLAPNHPHFVTCTMAALVMITII